MAKLPAGRLVPPGERGNRFIAYRVGIGGHDYEVSTETMDKKAAGEFARRFYDAVRAGRVPRSTAFDAVANAYIAAKRPNRNYRRYIERLKGYFGAREISDIVMMDIEAAANFLYPGAKATTLNCQVFGTMGMILHFAARNRLCDYMVVDKLREDEPEVRLPSPAAMPLLIANTEGRRRLFLVLLAYQGWRVTEALLIDWRSNVFLAERLFKLWIPKVGKWKWIEMHDAVFEELCAVPQREREGRVFPWGDRHNVYRWLRPLTRRLGVTFTPHMARHAFATDLHRLAGATRRDIAGAGSWTSEKSTARYTHDDKERTRRIMTVIDRGNTGEGGKERG